MKTLDELKAMSDKELFNLWVSAQFPFEMLPCGSCMTGHHRGYAGHRGCGHDILNDRVTAMSKEFVLGRLVTHENIEEIVALRLYHDDQYAPCNRVGAQIAQREKETVNG